MEDDDRVPSASQEAGSQPAEPEMALAQGESPSRETEVELPAGPTGAGPVGAQPAAPQPEGATTGAEATGGGLDRTGRDYVVPLVHLRIPGPLVEIGYAGALAGGLVAGAVDWPAVLLIGGGAVIVRHRLAAAKRRPVPGRPGPVPRDRLEN